MAENLDPGTPDVDVAPEPDGESSLADHEAQFGAGRRGEPPSPEPGPDDESEPDGRRRDESGKFVKGQPTPRHRAAKQQAGVEDVPRIKELTRRLRETEERLSAAEARTAAAAVPAAAQPAAVAKPPDAPKRPIISDFQTYEDFQEAMMDWKVAEARRVDTETRTKDAENAKLTESWRQRTEAAKAKYPDFEQVALKGATRIPQGSLIDAWILEHRSGADVLYTLQSNPTELDRILALPLFDQVEALALLAQRTGQAPREPAVRTGAAAASVPKVAPRPPTPVRTSAVPAPDEPPDYETTDVSLSTHEKYFPQHRR